MQSLGTTLYRVKITTMSLHDHCRASEECVKLLAIFGNVEKEPPRMANTMFFTALKGS